MRFAACARALPISLVLLATACGGDEFTARELAVTSLVSAQAGETVTCHDNHAVSSEFYSWHRVGYSCYNDDGLFYGVGVYPDGTLAELSGPMKLELVG